MQWLICHKICYSLVMRGHDDVPVSPRFTRTELVVVRQHTPGQ